MRNSLSNNFVFLLSQIDLKKQKKSFFKSRDPQLLDDHKILIYYITTHCEFPIQHGVCEF